MIKLLARTEEAARSLFTLMFPMASGADSAEGADFAPRQWVARSAVVSLVMAGLYGLNRARWLGLSEFIHFGRLGEFWLPLFALTLYALLWTGWLLYLFFSKGAEPLSREFGDIDDAWAEATAALAREKIGLESVPVYLVLGGTPHGEEPLFEAARLKLNVRSVPGSPDAPIHVSANRDAIWVVCPGASALGAVQPTGPGLGPMADAGPAFSPLGDLGADPLATTSATYAGGQGGGDATMGLVDILHGQKMSDLISAAGAHRAASGAATAVDPAVARERLRHLCRLIARDRGGLCPVNGILVLLPVTATGTRHEVASVAAACRADLTVAHETWRMRCPTVFMVRGLEDLTGFAELIERLPANQVNGRRGQRYPLAPDLKPELVPANVRDSVEWLADTYVPAMIYSSFQVESPGGEGIEDVLQTNSRLFLFMSEIRRRDDGLATLVKECLPTLPGEPMLFGGCYFAGTGTGPNLRAFAAGVLSRLIDDQDKVTWSEVALREDAAYHKRVGVAKIALNASIAILALASVYFAYGIAKAYGFIP